MEYINTGNKKKVIDYGKIKSFIKKIVDDYTKSHPKPKEKSSLNFQKDTSLNNISLYKDLNNIVSGDITDFSSKVDYAQKLYEGYGLYGNNIDILASLTVDNLIVSPTTDEESDTKYKFLAKFFNKMYKNTNRGLMNHANLVAKNFYKYGNVFAKNEGFESVTDYITVHNEDGQPMLTQMTMDMPKRQLLNPRVISIDSDDITDNTGIISYDGEAFDDIVQISDKEMWQKWGSMNIVKIAMPLYNKILIDVMSSSNIEGLLRSLTLIKIPDDYVDDADKIVEAVIAAKRANQIIALNEGVKVDIVGTKSDFLEWTDIKNQASDEIFEAMNLSRPMVTGHGTVSREVLQAHMMILVSKITKIQNILLPYFEDIVRDFAVQNNIKYPPSIYFSKPTLLRLLVDKFQLQLYDRGLMGGSTLISDIGYSVDNILEDMRMEQKMDYKDLGFGIMRNNPYQTKDGDVNDPNINKSPDDDNDKGRPGEPNKNPDKE